MSPTVISLLETDKDPLRRRSRGTSTDLLLFIPEKILQEFNLCFRSRQIPGRLCCLSAEPLRFLQLLQGQRDETSTTAITHRLLHFFSLPDSFLFSQIGCLAIPWPCDVESHIVLCYSHHLAACSTPSMEPSEKGAASEKARANFFFSVLQCSMPGVSLDSHH